MPDLKFDGKFYFSANTPSKGHPLLVPMISNPNFIENFKVVSPPGITELINGDLGITEQIMNPILTPIVSAIVANPLMVESIANINNLEKNNPDAVKSFLISQYIPKDLGLKPLEKTIITSMMESHKPLMEFLKIFLQTIGVAEDIFCRYLGTSIKVLGKEIGIPSRNPFYWDKSLGYTQTINSALKTMMEAADKSIAVMDSSISNKHPLKNTVTGAPKEKATGDTDLPAYYVAYFDEDGNAVEPPKWVKESNKWFSKQIADREGKLVKVGAPFKQLSDNLYEGVAELRKRQESTLDLIKAEKEELIKSIQSRLKEAEKITNQEERKNEIDSIGAETKEATRAMDEIIQVIHDIIDGSNQAGANWIDDEDKSKGINPPAIINEWIAKSRGSQFRSKYYPEQRTTVQTLVKSNGEAKEPYTFIPKFGVNYQGKFFNIEVPLAFDNQLKTSKDYSGSEFFDRKERDSIKDGGRTFSNKNVVSSLNMNPNNETKPFNTNNLTHFTNDIRNEYIPDNIKKFYLPLEWEEVLEYNVINKTTGQILSVEKEFVPFKIDVENDYELRLIKVINQPLINVGGNNNIDNFFPDPAGELILYVKDNYLQFLKTNKDAKTFNIHIKYPPVIPVTNNGTNGLTTPVVPLISNEFQHGSRYIDESVFVEGKYFYIRKNTKWGADFIDEDDSEIYQIKSINRTWVNINTTQNIIIDNITKTITFSSNSNIPSYIVESNGVNFKFIKGSINNNVGVEITSVNNNVLTYTGNLFNETIVNNCTYQFNNASYAETYQEFRGEADFEALIFTILDINYLPEPIKRGDNSIIIQGFDKNSLLSTISGRVQKEGNDITKFIQPNSDADNIYKILKTEKVKTRKGVEITSIKLDYPIPKAYSNKAYASDVNVGFYYPLRIYTVPQLNNSGASNKATTVETSTGTLYTQNNTIPPNLNIESPDKTLHSTPDLDENNLLKEGVIYHGLDPRYVDRKKWKVFYLVEAIKKDNNDIAPINGKYNPIEAKKKTPNGTSGKKGKEWYGLIDKFTALPMIATKLIPLIAGKVIPLAIKIIQMISNPKKIKDLLLDIALMDEDISKFPKNFKPFSKSGIVGKEKQLSKQKAPKSFDDYDKKTQSSSLHYGGPQIGKKNPTPVFLLDGQALAEFGKGAFGKPLFSFGAELKNGDVKVITKLKKNKSVNAEPETRDQPIFNMILNFVKLPFEIIFQIFKWIMDWIKKLLNPVKIPSALSEFLSFKWLLDILGKKSIFKIMGLKDASDPAMQQEMNNFIKNVSGAKAQELFNDVLSTLRGNDLGFVEVMIYDILKNGKKIGQDIVERPYSGGDLSKKDVKKPNGEDASLNDINNGLNNGSGNSDGSGSGNKDNPFPFCGERSFSLLKMFPVPFFNTDVSYNNCELPIIFLKPLEIIAGLMTFIQNLLNGFLSMPISILGLEPTISIPKFGKEIPFANVLTELIDKLKASLPHIQT
jgi:hypothetical protein